MEISIDAYKLLVGAARSIQKNCAIEAGKNHPYVLSIAEDRSENGLNVSVAILGTGKDVETLIGAALDNFVGLLKKEGFSFSEVSEHLALMSSIALSAHYKPEERASSLKQALNELKELMKGEE